MGLLKVFIYRGLDRNMNVLYSIHRSSCFSSSGQTDEQIRAISKTGLSNWHKCPLSQTCLPSFWNSSASLPSGVHLPPFLLEFICIPSFCEFICLPSFSSASPLPGSSSASLPSGSLPTSLPSGTSSAFLLLEVHLPPFSLEVHLPPFLLELHLPLSQKGHLPPNSNLPLSLSFKTPPSSSPNPQQLPYPKSPSKVPPECFLPTS